jgi:hypothetical protein
MEGEVMNRTPEWDTDIPQDLRKYYTAAKGFASPNKPAWSSNVVIELIERIAKTERRMTDVIVELTSKISADREAEKTSS